MEITREEKRKKALELMERMGIYKPYIKAFKDENRVCFFESYGGYWAYQEPELMNKIKEVEQKLDCLVYAVTHEYLDFGSGVMEFWSLLFISDYKDEWDDLTCLGDNKFYVTAYVWNKTDEDCSETGTIGVHSFAGGIKRFC